MRLKRDAQKVPNQANANKSTKFTNHRICFTVCHKTVPAFFRKVLLFQNGICICFSYFESIETNRTKILQKRWCTRLTIGVEGVLGEERTFTYPPGFFLPLVFKNSSKSFIKFLPVTCVHLYRPDIANARRHYFLVHAVTSRSDCWIDSNMNWVDTFFLGSI